jgi:hypothetical protein
VGSLGDLHDFIVGQILDNLIELIEPISRLVEIRRSDKRGNKGSLQTMSVSQLFANQLVDR